MKNRLLRTTISFILIISLVFCEAAVGFAVNDASADNSGRIEDVPTTVADDKYADWTVKNVEYKDHVFASGNSFKYTGSAIKPVLSKLTVGITYEKDGSVESADKVITNFSDASISYSNNTSIGTGNMKVTVYGKTVDIPFSIVLGGPESLKTTPTSYKTIKLNWDKVAGAAGYVVYRSANEDSGYKAIKTITSGKTVTYSNTNLKLGNIYYYKVRSYRNVDGSKVYGGYSPVIKQRVQPATPVISSVKKASYNSIKITWKKVSGATGYRVYRSTSENGSYKSFAVVRGGKKVSCIDKKRTCGQVYYYKVHAFKRSGLKNHYSRGSAIKSGKTTPETAKFNSKTESLSTSVTLKWNKASGAKGYEIYRSTKSSSGYTLVNDITSSKTLSWNDNGLDSKTQYYYKIRSYTTVDGNKVYGAYSSVYTKYTISGKLETLVKKYKGKPYRWGGNTPKGWDCSGFVQWAINYLYGKKIPRTGGAQARGGKYVNKNNMSSWKPGDVLIYKRNGGGVSHVGLYIGGGKMMHALNSRYDTVIQSVSYYEKWDRGNYLSGVRRYAY